MKTHKILFEHLGEYSYTAKIPRRPYIEGKVDLEEQTTHTILGSDDFRPCPVNRWAVKEIELPDWLPAEEWCRNSLKWHFAWNEGLPIDYDENRARQVAYFFMDAQRRAVIHLLTKNLRSKFRLSLKRQLEDWLDTGQEHRKYPSPFSSRQWAAITKYDRGY